MFVWNFARSPPRARFQFPSLFFLRFLWVLQAGVESKPPFGSGLGALRAPPAPWGRRGESNLVAN